MTQNKQLQATYSNRIQQGPCKPLGQVTSRGKQVTVLTESQGTQHTAATHLGSQHSHLGCPHEWWAD